MIYYVEDDTNIRDLALYALEQSGLEAQGFAEAESFFAAVHQRVPNLVLLDIMLPGMDGMDVLRKLRNCPETSAIPVMMLTAKGTEYDKVKGLDSGADDYLVKPFGMMELVSRCRALLRRSSSLHSEEPDRQLVGGPITLSEATRKATAGDAELALTAKEFDLLRTLMENGTIVMSRERLLEKVWDMDFLGETRTVDVHVQTLRRKLCDALPGSERLIRTVRGVGYTFDGKSWED
ncbi:MAG: response regulator transcription factor [Coriobacteriia bacterium]|nr:response regulator transcription factor [Coriobacteriia bacterium]